MGSSRSSSSARVANAAISCTFWRLPFDSARTLLSAIELEALDQHVAVGDVGAAAQARQELERLGARQRGPQERLAGDVGDAPVGGDRLAPGVDAEQLGSAPALGRCSPSSRRIVVVLPAPFGPEVAVDLAPLRPSGRGRRARRVSP